MITALPATPENMPALTIMPETRPIVVLQHQIELAAKSTAYSEERKRLLSHEHLVAWDTPAKQSARPEEILANDIVLRIRETERYDSDLFGNRPGESIPGPDTRDMGGRILINKERIDQSDVFNIANHMPKGAHLHLHFNAEIPPGVLVTHARALKDTMFIRSTQPLLKPEDFDQTEIHFDVFPSGTKEGDVYSPTYVFEPKCKTPAHPAWNHNSAWMKWSDFRRRFPAQDVRIEGFAANLELDRAEQWACQKMIVTANHAYGEHQTTNGVWACFNQGTRAFKGLINYEGVYRWYIGHAVESMIRDKVMYAELRPMLLDKSIPSNDGTRRLNHKDQMAIICEELAKKEVELRERNELHLFPFGLKIIYCTPRSIPREMMEKELQDCLELKLAFPDLICGFDLVGAEDRPNHIGFYADLLVAFANTCKELDIRVPFMFHAGESLLDTGGSYDPRNSNLYDSLLLNSKRIGHGYALLKHPTLVKEYKARNICLELCPISNELLHLCANARQHIFPELLAAGLHCTLNADNPSLFR